MFCADLDFLASDAKYGNLDTSGNHCIDTKHIRIGSSVIDEDATYCSFFQNILAKGYLHVLIGLSMDKNTSVSNSECLHGLKFTISILIIAILFAPSVSAETTFPDDDNSFVIDDAEVLNESEEQDLEQISRELSDGWGTNVIVVIINSTADYQSSDNSENDSDNGTGNESSNQSSESPLSVREFTEALYDEWRLDSGNEWKDGVLLLLSTNQSGSWSWWYSLGCFWDDYMYVFDGVGSSADSNFDNGDWAGGLTIVSEDITFGIDDFWYENDGYVDPPQCERNSQQDDEYGIDDASAMDLIFGGICCLLAGGIVVGLIFLTSRAGNSGGPGFRQRFFRRGGYNDPYYDPYGYGHSHTEVHHHHHNNDSTPSSPSRQSRGGGSSPSRRSSGGGRSGGGRSGGGGGGGRGGGGGGGRGGRRGGRRGR